MPILDQWGRPITSSPPRRDVSAVLALDSRLRNYPARGLTPQRLAAILREADDGLLEQQHELFEEMEERDAYLFSLLQTRKLAAIGLDWRVEPADESSEAKRIAEAFQGMWEEIDQEDLLLDLLDAVPKGVSMMLTAWERGNGASWWLGQLMQVPGYNLLYKHEERRFVLSTRESPMGEPVQFGQAIEHRYKARSGIAPRAGLMRSIVWLYLFKHYALKDWVTYAEIFGQPYRLGKYDPATGNDEREALEVAVRSLGVDAAGVISKDTEIEIIEVARQGGIEVYNRLVQVMNREMAQAVLGQTLTSGEGESGTQALGKVHERVRLDLLRADVRTLAQTLRRDLIKPFVAFNFSPEKVGLAPYLAPEVEEQEDQEMKAKVISILTKEVGLKVPTGWLYEEFGIPEPSEQDTVVGGVQPPPVLTPPTPIAGRAANAALLEALQAKIPQGIMNGQQFIFEVIGNGIEAGATALNPALTALLKEIDASTSPEDLRQRLAALFPGLDLANLRRVVEASWLLSEMAGMLALREDTR